jgi:hypothetical protein
MLTVRTRQLNGGWLLELTGVLDGNTTSAQLGGDHEGTVVIDLRGVRAITSIGVRVWTMAMGGMRAQAHYYVNCPTSVVMGFNTVRGFAGKGQLLSLLLPYRCTNAHNFERVADLRNGSPILAGGVPCSTCSAAAELDDEPDDYLHFARLQGAPKIEPPAARVLAQLG